MPKKCYSSGVYDFLFVLGAVMKWDEEKGGWTFPDIIPEYPGKLVLGEGRAEAAALLADTASVILVTGGVDKHPQTGEIASRSEELSKFIVREFSVPRRKVVPIGTLNASHTMGNVENIVSYIEAHKKLLKTHKVGIVCPRFQLERARFMFEMNQYFKQNRIELNWLIVEDILMRERQEKWRERLEKLYRSPEAEINKQMEERGVEDLRAGRYEPKQ